MATATFTVVVAEVRGQKRLTFTAERRYRAFVDAQGIGTELRVRIDEPKKTRTVDQLRYWFGVPMAILSEKTGYTKLQCHYLCLSLCFGFVVDPQTGREIPAVPFSRGLTTKQFGELIEWCPAWAHETFGVTIPLPNKVDMDALPGYDETEAA